jgi:hypothetical protein
VGRLRPRVSLVAAAVVISLIFLRSGGFIKCIRGC